MDRRGPGPGRLRGLATVVLVVAIALAGCGGNGNNEDSASSGGASADGGGASAANGIAEGEGAAPAGQPIQQQREIIYTAEALVKVGDVEAAAAKATSIAEDAGGFLSGQDTQLEGDQDSRLTIRVPSAKFRPVLDAVSALGSVQSRSITSDDVTAQVVDLQGRLDSQTASAERLRGLIAQAPDTQAIVTIEAELAKREAEVESLQGQLRVLDDQTTLATITVDFTEKAGDPTVDKNLPGFVQALKSGGVAFVTVLTLIVAALGYTLPFLLVAAAGWYGYRRYRRRHPKPDSTGAFRAATSTALPPFPRAPDSSPMGPARAAGSPAAAATGSPTRPAPPRGAVATGESPGDAEPSGEPPATDAADPADDH